MRVLVALGGNALQEAGGTGEWSEMVARMRATTPALVELVREGHQLVVTHGNGPQVGALIRQNELGRREVPPLPIPVLGAESQGEIGYLVQQELEAALRASRSRRTVVVVVSRMEVSAKDPSFRHPSKPVGSYYSDAEARLLRKREGWEMSYDGARGGWRRVVASPRPLRWLEGDTVLRLWESPGGASTIFVVSGGGGVPVVHRRARYEGIDAVIDKDLAAAVVAQTLHVDLLAIVTDVPAVAIGFRRPWEQWLGDISAPKLRRYLKDGEFGEGSMAPKVQAVLSFLQGGGKRAVITDIPSLPRALRGEAGTRVSL